MINLFLPINVMELMVAVKIQQKTAVHVCNHDLKVKEVKKINKL